MSCLKTTSLWLKYASGRGRSRYSGGQALLPLAARNLIQMLLPVTPAFVAGVDLLRVNCNIAQFKRGLTRNIFRRIIDKKTSHFWSVSL